MVNIETVRKNYPLHWLIWHNSYVELDKELSTNQVCVGPYAPLRAYFVRVLIRFAVICTNTCPTQRAHPSPFPGREILRICRAFSVDKCRVFVDVNMPSRLCNWYPTTSDNCIIARCYRWKAWCHVYVLAAILMILCVILREFILVLLLTLECHTHKYVKKNLETAISCESLLTEICWL